MKLKTFLKLVLFLAPFAALGQTKLSPQAFSQPIDSVYNFENVSLFVAGETHYRPANFTLQFELFKKLHEKGFDIILYENCYSKCFFMNEYIKGENIEVPFQQQLMATELIYIDSLKQYYSQLPANNKFKMIGIDLEWPRELNILAIEHILSKIESTAYFKPYLNKFEVYQTAETKELKPAIHEVFEELLVGLNKDSLQAKKCLGRYYNDFKTIVISSIKHKEAAALSYDFSKDVEQLNARDQFMFENIKSVYQENSNAKCYLQIGATHITLSKDSTWRKLNGYESVITRLEQDSLYKGKTICNLIVYKGKAVFENRAECKVTKELFKQLKKNSSVGAFTFFNLSVDKIEYKEQLKNYQYIIYNSYLGKQF